MNNIKVVEAKNHRKTGYNRYTLLINDEYYISFSENANTGEIRTENYSSKDLVEKKESENNTKIPIDILYLVGE